MSSLFKTKNIIYIVMILLFIIVISYIMSYIGKQNREYERLSREAINRQKVEERIVEETVNTEIELPASEEYEYEVIETRPPLDDDVIMIF